MAKLLLAVLALFALSALLVDAGRPQVLSKSFIKRPGTQVLDHDFDMSVFDVEFDQPLHRVYALNPCPGGNDVKVCATVPACAPCDYTNPGVCNGTIVPNVGNCTCQVNHTACGRTVIIPDVDEYHFQADPGRSVFLTFHIDFTAPENRCKSFAVWQDILYGPISMGLSSSFDFSSNPLPYRRYSLATRYGGPMVNVCPNYEHFRHGTYVLRLVCRIDGTAGNGRACDAKIKITTHALPEPAATPAPACSLPAGVTNATHSCLKSGQYWDEPMRDPDFPDSIGTKLFYFAHLIQPNPDPAQPTVFVVSTSIQTYLSFVNKFPIAEGDAKDLRNVNTPYLESYAPSETQGGNNCQPPNVCPNFAELQNGFTRDAYFSLYLTQPTWIYAAVYDIHEMSWFQIESRPSEVWKRSMTVPLASLNPFSYQLASIQFGQVWCKDDNGNAQQFTFPYNYDQSNGNNLGGTNHWYPLPAIDPNPFYPQLAFAWISGSKFKTRALIDGSNNTARPGHINFVVNTYFYPNGNGEAVERLSRNIDNTATCQLNLHGNLVGGDGWSYGNLTTDPTPLIAAYPNSVQNLLDNWDPNPGIGDFVEKTLSQAANGTEPGRVVEQIGNLLNMTISAAGNILTDITYQLDVYKFSLAISNLLVSIKDSYDTKPQEVPEFNENCYATPGTDAFRRDPCCNQTLGYTVNTCIPRAVNVTVDAFDALSAGAGTCGDANCYTTFIQDVASADQDNQLGTCAAITENSVFFTYRFYEPFTKCRDQYLGKYIREPSTCFNDADCASFGVKCDMVRKQCLVPVLERFTNYTRCFLGTANKLLLIQMAKNVFEVDPSLDTDILTNVDRWVAHYNTTNECSDPTGLDWGVPGRSNYPFSSAFKNFDMCNPTPQGSYSGLDPFPTTPWQCQSRQLGPAAYSPSVSTNAGCANVKSCNWFVDFGHINPNVTLAEEVCLNYWSANNNSFCGASDNGLDYYPVNVTQTECQTVGKVACFHNDGTVTVENSAAACEAMSTCSIAGAANAAACAALGECQAPATTQPRPLLRGTYKNQSMVLSQLSYTPATTQYTFNPVSPGPQTFYLDYGYDPVNTSGACFEPFGVPPVLFACGSSLLSGNQRMTVLGCRSFRLLNQTACLNASGVWKTAPTNEAQCLALTNNPPPGGVASTHFCARPIDLPNIVNYFPPTIYTDQTQTECEATPGGVWTARHKWVAATYKTSTARPLSWVNATYGPRLSYGSVPTPDTNALAADIITAIGDIYIFEQRSTIFCAYGRLSTALGTLDCLCNADDPASCASKTSSSAVSSACGGAAGVAFVPPASIGFSDNTVVPVGGCINFAVTIASHIAYQNTQPAGVPSYFIDFSELDDYSFRNGAEALIGQIVGDGISIEITGEPSGSIENTSVVCSKVALDITINYPDLYTEYDWARAGPVTNGVKTFILVNAANSSYDPLSGSVCGSFVVVPGELYFPVRRAANPDSLIPNIFKPAEFGLVIVLIIAYCAMILLILFKLRYIITIRAFPFSAGVTIPLFGLYLVRLIYFSMLIAYQFVTDTGGLGPWVLVELPLLLYFATTIYFVLNWAFVTRTIKKLGKARRIQTLTIRYFAIVMALLTLIFIAFLISFALLQPVPVTSCDGRIITVDDSIPNGIAIGYRVWMGALCAVVGICFVSYASFILAAMQQVTSRGGNDKIARQRERSKRNLTFMAIVCSLSLFIEAVYMLVLAFYTTFDKNIASLVIMLITEVTPGIGILVMLDLSEMAKTAELTRTQSRMTGGGSSTATRGTGLKSLTDAVNNASNTSNGSTGSAASTTGNPTGSSANHTTSKSASLSKASSASE